MTLRHSSSSRWLVRFLFGAAMATFLGASSWSAEPAPGTAEKSERITRKYDIHSLLLVVPDFTDAPDLSLPQDGPARLAGHGLFPEGGNGQPPADAAPAALSDEPRTAQLTHLLQKAMSPGNWTPACTMQVVNGMLAVTAPESAQHEIAGIIAELRQERLVQVTLETRIISLDTELPEGLDAALSKKLRLATFEDNIALTDSEVAQLMRACQGSQTCAFITAPRITLFNHQHAYVLVTTQKAFVAGYVPNKGKAGFDPELKVVEEGTVLASQANVSADQKHIALNLALQIAELKGMSKIPFAGDPEKKLEIEVPDLRVREIRATLSMADGETILLDRVRDISKEHQPAAARDPKRSFLGDHVLVLVKPKVVIEKD